MVTTLDTLRKGQKALIVSLKATDDAERRIAARLSDFGFFPGEEVSVYAEAFPGGDPIAVKTGGSLYALRRTEASLVTVSTEE